ncbi:hypothetical protein PGT21_023947 [Puccinia graminis f. sp. tritici]|uniref:RING-type domain-containing protein n=1 Tax=Puccinia graminis f. sp. tritici TaxID=56615 RepID=A0A5B0LX36_PUCGR|nr:hypothetical protein PGT21_023947 [Puccinia graminis f. sp. tritici]
MISRLLLLILLLDRYSAMEPSHGISQLTGKSKVAESGASDWQEEYPSWVASSSHRPSEPVIPPYSTHQGQPYQTEESGWGSYDLDTPEQRRARQRPDEDYSDTESSPRRSYESVYPGEGVVGERDLTSLHYWTSPCDHCGAALGASNRGPSSLPKQLLCEHVFHEDCVAKNPMTDEEICPKCCTSSHSFDQSLAPKHPKELSDILEEFQPILEVGALEKNMQALGDCRGTMLLFIVWIIPVFLLCNIMR